MIFSKFAKLCNYHHHPVLEHFHLPSKNPSAPWHLIPIPNLNPRQSTFGTKTFNLRENNADFQNSYNLQHLYLLEPHSCWLKISCWLSSSSQLAAHLLNSNSPGLKE